MLRCSVAVRHALQCDAPCQIRTNIPHSGCISRTRRPAISRRRSHACAKGWTTAWSARRCWASPVRARPSRWPMSSPTPGVPAIVLAPNKTLAAQLYAEMREFFPHNAVEYFVSYYDYYQPEAYVPARDLFIEKDSAINEHIEQMRLSATKSLLERRDTIIVGTVSVDLRHRQSQRLPRHDPGAAAQRPHRPARHHRAPGLDAVRAQRGRVRARHLPRARRHDRRLPGRARRGRGAHRTARRRDRKHPAVRSADRAACASACRASPSTRRRTT